MKNLFKKIHFHKWERKSLHYYLFEDEEIFRDDPRYKDMKIGKNCHGDGLAFVKVCKICGKEKQAPMFLN